MTRVSPTTIREGEADVSNRPYRPGAFEIPCRADWGVTPRPGREARASIFAQAWALRARPIELLRNLVTSVAARWSTVRAWAGSLNHGEPLASLTRLGQHAKH
jgi:hypothetical protein